jgi:hypothetical protein
MFTLTKIFKKDLTDELLQRLYDESYDRNVIERNRVGDEKLRDVLYNGYSTNPIVRYDVDGYTVGLASYHEKLFNGKKYYSQNFCVYGKDQTGSRSWWWSEDFQIKSWEWMKNEGLCGIIALHNPDSEIGKAALAAFGRFDKYYNTPIVVEPNEANTLITPVGKDILKSFIIDLIE